MGYLGNSIAQAAYRNLVRFLQVYYLPEGPPPAMIIGIAGHFCENTLYWIILETGGEVDAVINP
jgi:hypothetical protein